MSTRKTDNANLAAKLRLRLEMIGRFHPGPFTVLDCCEAKGRIWGYLGSRFPCEVWGVDLDPMPGRLAIDSVRLLETGLSFDVIDVDTYGSPWNHWFALLPHIRRPTTVFLTLGQLVRGTTGSVGSAALKAAGLSFPSLRVPPAFHVKLKDLFPRYCLAAPREYGLKVACKLEAASGNRNVRYFGIRLEPGTPG